MGMKSNGSFTKYKNAWITFTPDEVEKITNASPAPGLKVPRPYGATKQGYFVRAA